MSKTSKKFKKNFAKIVAMPVIGHVRRQKVRRFIIDFHLKDVPTLLRFTRYEPRPNSVLLVEPNNCHGEVIAGYVEYFRKLGFSVDVLVSDEIIAEAPFCRLASKDVRVFSSGYVVLGWILKLAFMRRYRHVVLMSSAYYRKSADESYVSMLGEFPVFQTLDSLFVVEHDLVDIPNFGEEDLLKRGRLLTLGRFREGTFASPFLFGDCATTPKNAETTFITVGAIKGFRRNHQALIDAIGRLADEGRAFSVVVVGSGSLDNLPEKVRPFVKIAGRLDFPQMFDRIEQADFFLPLLDAESPDHDRYITTGVTGSAQLIYAFSKVPVMHPKFASFYGYSGGNAILSESLVDGMRAAIEMSAADYDARQKALSALAANLEAESLANLKRVMFEQSRT